MTWPFEDPPNTAVFTSADVVERLAPILFVTHDADDGAWQFHSAHEAPDSVADARVVSLATICAQDQSLLLLADLPVGWSAHRDQVGGPWQRRPLESPGAS